jgi:hypothetical protein
MIDVTKKTLKENLEMVRANPEDWEAGTFELECERCHLKHDIQLLIRRKGQLHPKNLVYFVPCPDTCTSKQPASPQEWHHSSIG